MAISNRRRGSSIEPWKFFSNRRTAPAPEPRIREHFDGLVERISAYEVTALAQGDGFTEKKYEPATIDELLAISTFEQPPATPETTQAVTEDPTMHDIDIR
jgi:hypothetical protein